MKNIKLALLAPIIITSGIALSSCESKDKVENLIEDSEVGLRMLIESISSRGTVDEFKTDTFSLLNQNMINKDGVIIGSYAQSSKNISNMYENSFREKSTLLIEEKKDPLLNSESSEPLMNYSLNSDAILKIDPKKHDYTYTYEQSSSDESNINGNFIFTLSSNEEMDSTEKAKSYLQAKNLNYSIEEKINKANTRAYEDILHVVDYGEKNEKYNFYTINDNKDHILFKLERQESENRTFKEEIEFKDGYVNKKETYIEENTAGEGGIKYQIQNYTIKEYSYVADRFSNPKANDFTNIELDMASSFPILNDVVYNDGFDEEII